MRVGKKGMFKSVLYIDKLFFQYSQKSNLNVIYIILEATATVSKWLVFISPFHPNKCEVEDVYINSSFIEKCFLKYIENSSIVILIIA